MLLLDIMIFILFYRFAAVLFFQIGLSCASEMAFTGLVPQSLRLLEMRLYVRSALVFPCVTCVKYTQSDRGKQRCAIKTLLAFCNSPRLALSDDQQGQGNQYHLFS